MVVKYNCRDPCMSAQSGQSPERSGQSAGACQSRSIPCLADCLQWKVFNSAHQEDVSSLRFECSPVQCSIASSCTSWRMMAAQAAVIERCHRQSAAGKGRCSELEKYMKRCQRVRATCLFIVFMWLWCRHQQREPRRCGTVLTSPGWLQRWHGMASSAV